MKLLFLPAIRLLDKLSYPFKFGLIILVCAAASLVLLSQIFTSLREEIRVTQQEIAGLQLFDAGFAVILKTQQHRGLSAGVLGGSSDLVPRREQKAVELKAAMNALDAAIAADPAWAVLKPGWEKPRAELLALADTGLRLSGPENFAAHTQTIGLMLRWLGELGDVSGLALDPEQASANLIVPMLQTLPELSERLGQLRARGTNIVARRELLRTDEYGVVSLLAEINRAESALLERLRRTARANAALSGRLGTMGQEISSAVAQVRTTAEQEVLDQRFTISSAAFFELVTGAIDTAVRNFDQVLRPETGRLLEARLSSLNQRLMTQIVISAVAMVLAAYLFIGVYLAILRSVRELSAGAQAFAAGDYRVRVVFSAHDELAEVASQFNAMADQVSGLIREIQQGAEKVGSAATELNASARQVLEGSETQSDAASGVAAAVEEMSSGVDGIAHHAATAQQLAEDSGRLSAEGREVMQKSVAEMERIAQAVDMSSEAIQVLGEKSHQISTIVDAIRDIADQTNLLALNAAIEAARAGESGRGFAVVVDEVRKLAERTSLATQEISGMVVAIQQGTERAVETMQQGVTRVRDGVQMSKRAGASMAQISTGAGQVLDAVREISTALNEQSQASTQIARNIERIADMAEHNSGTVRETASTAETLEALASALRQQASRFRV
ncbi:MAG: methyl-accepting chemotaxis protein [Thauera sp.]|jgi:methyl-accepting chemotaxis protein|nr:methyl-accepting chemotaxis protein [Thauera sp.]